MGLPSVPVTWPIGCGLNFQGIYDILKNKVYLYKADKVIDLGPDGVFGTELENQVSGFNLKSLRDEIELLQGAGNEFDMDAISTGKLSPVYPEDDFFSGFIFKIQANMNPAHRDRLAFFRICSGTFTRGMSVKLSRTGKEMKLSQSTMLMANQRENVEEAIAGDIIGIYDTGSYQIGDTLSTRKEPLFFEPLPTFPPELFALVTPKDTMKAKQFQKGVAQLAQEGAIQVYRNEYNEVIIGAVGQLQFEVFQYRLENEYNAKVRMDRLEFSLARWVETNSLEDVKDVLDSRTMLVFDHFDRPLILFANQFTLNYFAEKHQNIKLVEALDVKQ